MKRRNFLQKLPVAVSIPFAIGGIPMRLMAENPLTQLTRTSDGDNDKVLIILQMHGGNDGLNCLIPVDAYEQYYSRRANIAIPAKNGIRKYIPLDSTLALDSQVGLHPDMLDMKAMYDQGRMGFIQGVSYKNNNGSHFRGRDIWFMGGGSDDYFNSGWLGRYLQSEYANIGSYPDDFPDDAHKMPDPLALEMGSDVSLLFHQNGNIPTSIGINSPSNFFNLVNELEGFKDLDIDKVGIPPEALKNSPYWKEMDWILKLEDKSKDYAKRLYDVWAAGTDTSVTYPEKYPYNAPSGSVTNYLTPQLKLIARMLGSRGASVDNTGNNVPFKTRVFMIKIGGFDTHANQVENYDPTMGSHAALMYHISSAMKAFQADLRARGIEDRVLTLSTSEFGRRINSNGSFGTDHGTGGPVFLFGSGVKAGMTGKVPDLSSDKDNIELQYDYRQIYANILKDWMGVEEDKIATSIFGEQGKLPDDPVVTPRDFINGPKIDNPTEFYTPLPLASTIITGVDEFNSSRYSLEDCYPNPAKDKTTLFFKVNSRTTVTITLIDNQGREIKTLIDKVYEPGTHREEVSLDGIQKGNYIYQMRTLFYKQSKKLVIIK